MASMRRSHSRLAPGTSPYTRLKSLAQSLYRAVHQVSQSPISFCHSVIQFSGPAVGHSTYLAPSNIRCLALTISFIWASVGLVEVWRLVIQVLMDLSTRSCGFLASETVLRILLRSLASSARNR